MGMESHCIAALCALVTHLLVASFVQSAADSVTFSIANYGLKGTEDEDITKAFSVAWKAACSSTSPSKLIVPKGTYVLRQVVFEGPCKAPLELQVHGTIKAPEDPSDFIEKAGWISFQRIDRFALVGNGTFDGQGSTAWSQNDCHKTGECNKLPINIRFNFITNGLVQDITSLNSKLFHINVLGCNNLTFSRVNIKAPEDSPNTDGIHIGRSKNINITDSVMSTGDDCISMGRGSENIAIERVKCGPGHGISVGSLGRYTKEEPVSGIIVRNCTFFNTDNGVRVKTWMSSEKAIATGLYFQDIAVVNVSNPVVIDQEYCPYNHCKAKKPSQVKLSNISFRNIHGTSSTQMAMKLACSSGVPCENVEISDIDIKYTGSDGDSMSDCTNVSPKIFGKQYPSPCVAANSSS
ncbi:PREDICTED: exopolygalacturonase-like [Tarenaya hassleriana]|uniref:exopolygalacturonase-like n=1 Tax=Tarenaya hassleriana TaxID=28532 RepID=UPI00053C9540|nr:PREDICTED: exopolygalacturonase-like [Tarenaya hassleriana]